MKQRKNKKSYIIRLKETNIKTGTGGLNYPTAELKTYSDCFKFLAERMEILVHI